MVVPHRVLCLGVAALASALFTPTATPQAMIEYSHAAGGAARAAASLRKASPAARLQKVQDALGSAAGRQPSYRPHDPPDGAVTSSRTPEVRNLRGLTVVHAGWGPPPARLDVGGRTASGKDDSSEPASATEREPTFDAAAEGLSEGMQISEVLKILGDPAIRTSGLAGRGYDEKLIYLLATGRQIVVYGAHGRARGFTSAQGGKKTQRTLLRSGTSVIP